MAADDMCSRSVRGFQDPVHRGEKVVAVKRNMEADQVRAQKTVQQLGLPGTNAECFRVGPWNVPEDCHARIRPRLLTSRGSRAR